MYSFDATVRYSECDENGNLSLTSLIDYLQDCAMFHSEHVGHGYGYMKEHHFAWFIAAWQIEVLRLPRFLEHVTTSTVCYRMNGAAAHRNFTIADEGGRLLVRADSIWFTFDTQAMTACHIPAGEAEVYVTDEPPLDMPKTVRKIRVGGEGRAMAPIVVTEQHLDTNHHVNNAQYVAMADAIVRTQRPEFATHRICVQYKTMALLGDTIVPRLHEVPGGYVVDLADPEGSSYAIVKMEEA